MKAISRSPLARRQEFLVRVDAMRRTSHNLSCGAGVRVNALSTEVEFDVGS